jgi:peroxiredoxin/uncharacterized membrane protein YphA (DoxX/SURF4 family)
MEGVLLTIRLVLFGIFALAGIGKLLDLDGSKKAVKDFGVPDKPAGMFGTLLPLAELAIAASLLFISTSWYGAIAAFALLGLFIVGMAYQMAKGNAPDCHCFGQIHSAPVSKKSLLRNMLFAAFAVFLVFPGPGRQGIDLAGDRIDGMQLILILVVIALAAAILFYLKKISAQQETILRRIDLLETISREGLPVERSNAGNPDDALPIGTPFPNFELPNLGGRKVAFEHLMAEAKPILFFFIGPNCVPCQSLLPEIEAWRGDIGDRVKFVFISTGTPEGNIEKFGGNSGIGTILLQKEREVAEFVYARWTPTALFVGSDGLIASRPAVGDNAIRDLVEKIKKENLDAEFVFIANGNGGAPDRVPRIGEEIPEFSLNDLEGREISAGNLRGKKTLVTFWSTTCPHCANMMEELKAWEKERSPADPELLVFSDGELEVHRELALDSTLVLDAGYKTAEKFGMFGTPSAVLVNEDGRIVSETAVGAPNIWALIGKRKL